MERLKCKTCGSYSMVPMEVAVEEEDQPVLGSEQESRFYTCHVCGDNWLSVKETDSEGTCQITFIHQMGMMPVLKRIAHLETRTVAATQADNHWEYFEDDEEIDAEVWQEKLTTRRKVLKSICCN